MKCSVQISIQLTMLNDFPIIKRLEIKLECHNHVIYYYLRTRFHYTWNIFWVFHMRFVEWSDVKLMMIQRENPNTATTSTNFVVNVGNEGIKSKETQTSNSNGEYFLRIVLKPIKYYGEWKYLFACADEDSARRQTLRIEYIVAAIFYWSSHC